MPTTSPRDDISRARNEMSREAVCFAALFNARMISSELTRRPVPGRSRRPAAARLRLPGAGRDDGGVGDAGNDRRARRGPVARRFRSRRSAAGCCPPVMNEGRRSMSPSSLRLRLWLRAILAELLLAIHAELLLALIGLARAADRAAVAAAAAAARSRARRRTRRTRLRRHRRLRREHRRRDALLLILLRLILPELFLRGGDDAEIVLGVLIVVFGGDRIACALRVARELDVFLGQVRGSTANLDLRTVGFVNPGHRILATPVIIIVVVVAVHRRCCGSAYACSGRFSCRASHHPEMLLSTCKCSIRCTADARPPFSFFTSINQLIHRGHIGALLLPRTYAHAGPVSLDRQNVVLSSRRKIRLSFVPGHLSRAALSAIASNETCLGYQPWVDSRPYGPAPLCVHPQRLRGQRPGTDLCSGS